MRFAFSLPTRVRRTEAYAWLTDFTEDDHRGEHWGKGYARVILSKTERRVEMRDAWRRGFPIHFVVELDPPGAWHVRAGTRGVRWEATFLLEDRPDGGSDLRADYRLEGVGFGKILLPLLGPWMERTIRRDFATHIEEMESHLA